MIKTPSLPTLKKYGLNEDEWRAMAEAQNGRCFVCEKEPGTGRLCIDHDHVRGWKNMPPERRKLYVRGLLCWTCNFYYCGKGITVEKSKNVTKYLEQYAARKPSP